MGNHQSYKERFRAKYAFNQLINDEKFGQIKIYRKKQLNFDYVMILQKYINRKQLPPLLKEIEQIYNSILCEEPPRIVRIYDYQVIEEKVLTCNIPLLRLYIEYYNFTLYDLMAQHSQKNHGFSYDEVMYIFKSIFDTFSFLNKINPSYLHLDIKSIYLTPQGQIKFNPIKGEDFFQEQNPLCNAILYQTHKKQMIYVDQINRKLLLKVKKLMLTFANMQKNSQLINLYKKMEKCKKLEEVKYLLQKPSVDCLTVNKRTSDVTDSFELFVKTRPQSENKRKSKT